MTPKEKELINEIEQLILHAEEDSLTYSVLEHARQLILSKHDKAGKFIKWLTVQSDDLP